MNELVSIIVPVYNTEKYIDECIKSVLQQPFDKWELIIVDDGSTDKSGEICDQYADVDIRIKVLHQKNAGQAEARNVALKECTGDYLLFLDSDDRLAEDAIGKLYRLVDTYQADIGVGGIRSFDSKGMKEVYKTDEDTCWDSEKACEKMFLRKGMDSNTVAKLYRRKLWEEIQFPSGTIFEDVPIMYKIFLKSNRVSEGAFVVYEQRSRKGSTTKSEFRNEKKIYTEYSWKVYEDILKVNPKLQKSAYIYYLTAVVDNFINLSCSMNQKEYGEYWYSLKKIIEKNFYIICKTSCFYKRRMRVLCCILGLTYPALKIRNMMYDIKTGVINIWEK